MKRTKLLATAIVIALMLAAVPQVKADISNAAVLYLRIAPGARAAGMGEAYVAISDDATSTHWNPAGLGAYPLSPMWVESSIPEYLRPVSNIAALKARRSGEYLAFDIWAITPGGLARYDNKKWYTYEVFDTKTDQTVRGIVASYFGLTDEDRISAAVSRVARINNKESLGYLDSLKSEVVAALPETYAAAETVRRLLDSLIAGYDRCLIDWDKVAEIRKHLNDGLKDGALDASETDRVYFAVEKSRTRFIPEKLNIEYSALFDAHLTGMVSTGDFMVIGTQNGMYAYNGSRWQIVNVHNGLPSPMVTALAAGENYVLIATDSGIVSYDGESLAVVGERGQLPDGPVDAIAAADDGKAWAVVGTALYHFDGTSWSDNRAYTVVLDDTVEKIVDKLALYGGAKEREDLRSAVMRLNGGADSSGEPGQLQLEPGQVIRVPYTTGLKGEVTDLHVGPEGRLWVGTGYGVVYFDGESWHLPGYRDHEVQSQEELADLLQLAQPGLSAEWYEEAFMDINDLEGDEVAAGTVVKLYRGLNAAPVKKITSRRNKTYVATEVGLIEYDGEVWSSTQVMGLDKALVEDAQSIENEVWFAGEDKIVAKANSRTDISTMWVKWLPELADDLYYAFFSAATHKEGWGTFGGNITYISYGTISRTGEQGQDLGTFESFDVAVTASWGTPITDKLKTGISAKLLYSKLADQGAGSEEGEGTSTGFAVDFGFLYHLTRSLDLGLAITNLGPDMAYIDAGQADPLPRNLALGLAYKALQTDYYHFLITAEVNKSLVGVDDKFRDELEQLVLNGGGEFSYANLLALRAGYIYDQEGDIKTATLGVGLGPVGILKFDFSYIPSNKDGVLDNTLRISIAAQP